MLKLVKPVGDIYAPIYFDSDVIIKLVLKSMWVGFMPTLTTWKLVIDIDDRELALSELISRIYESDWSNELCLSTKQ